jgi:hypothetical protein
MAKHSARVGDPVSTHVLFAQHHSVGDEENSRNEGRQSIWLTVSTMLDKT